jgi:hypothetical protein
MKYNAEYDRYVTKEGLVYRYSKNQDKLILCKFDKPGDRYFRVRVSKPKVSWVLVHRLVFETFIWKIPDGLEIDHFDTNKENNSLNNLILCTHKENCNNQKTREHNSQSKIGICSVYSDFGRKFKEHFGITNKENPSLYRTERAWYRRHNKTCRWEL